MPVPCLRHPLCPGTRTAVIRRRRAARSASPLTTRLQGAPAETCPHAHPGPSEPDACARPALTSPLERGRVRGPPQGATVGCSLRHLLTKARVRRLHAPPTPPHTTRARRTIPQAPRVEWLGPLGPARQPSPLAPAPALEAVCRPRSCVLAGCQGSVPMALSLGCARGPVAHAPAGPCAVGRPPQQGPPLPHGSGIARGPALTTMHRKGGSIAHLMGEPWGLPKTRPPKPLPSGCVTTDHRRGGPQPTARWGLGHCVEQTLGVTCGQGACA
jgi:hypothetical protein